MYGLGDLGDDFAVVGLGEGLQGFGADAALASSPAGVNATGKQVPFPIFDPELENAIQ
jgi:hypothetical protein